MGKSKIDMWQFIDEMEQKIETAKMLGYSSLYITRKVIGLYVNKFLSGNTPLKERHRQSVLFKYELANILNKKGYITQVEWGGITVIWNDKQNRQKNSRCKHWTVKCARSSLN